MILPLDEPAEREFLGKKNPGSFQNNGILQKLQPGFYAFTRKAKPPRGLWWYSFLEEKIGIPQRRQLS